jgi:hypothetical protein
MPICAPHLFDLTVLPEAFPYGMTDASSIVAAAHGRAADVLTQLDAAVQQTIILASCVFPRTTNLDDRPVARVDYGGTLDGFVAAVAKVRRNPELKALGTSVTLLQVMCIMSKSDTFDALLMDMVDAVVFQSAGRHILRMNNTAVPTDVSGRSVFLELSDVRLRASMMVHERKARAVDYTVHLIYGVATLGVGSAVLALLTYLKQR